MKKPVFTMPAHWIAPMPSKEFEVGFARGRSLAELFKNTPEHVFEDGTPWSLERFCEICVPNTPSYIEGIKVGWVAYKLQQ